MTTFPFSSEAPIVFARDAYVRGEIEIDEFEDLVWSALTDGKKIVERFPPPTAGYITASSYVTPIVELVNRKTQIEQILDEHDQASIKIRELRQSIDDLKRKVERASPSLSR